MSLPFRRNRPAQGGRRAPRSAFPTLAQRAWEVEVILCTLHPLLREALRPRLLPPASQRRWQPSDPFSPQRSPITHAEAGDHTRPVGSKLLRDELSAILQTLDQPPEALSGLARNGLLTVHGIRLRQLEVWLWPFYAAREVTRMVA